MWVGAWSKCVVEAAGAVPTQVEAPTADAARSLPACRIGPRCQGPLGTVRPSTASSLTMRSGVIPIPPLKGKCIFSKPRPHRHNRRHVLNNSRPSLTATEGPKVDDHSQPHNSQTGRFQHSPGQAPAPWTAGVANAKGRSAVRKSQQQTSRPKPGRGRRRLGRPNSGDLEVVTAEDGIASQTEVPELSIGKAGSPWHMFGADTLHDKHCPGCACQRLAANPESGVMRSCCVTQHGASEHSLTLPCPGDNGGRRRGSQ